MIRDKKLAVGMAAGFVLGILWGAFEGVSPGEIFLYGSVAAACSLITYPFWRDRKR